MAKEGPYVDMRSQIEPERDPIELGTGKVFLGALGAMALEKVARGFVRKARSVLEGVKGLKDRVTDDPNWNE